MRITKTSFLFGLDKMRVLFMQKISEIYHLVVCKEHATLFSNASEGFIFSIINVNKRATEHMPKTTKYS